MKRVPTRVGHAGTKGMGVFASGPIRRSAVIGSFRGKPRWIWEIPQELWPYTIQVDYDRYVVPRRRGVVWYMNHSCAPNCVISGSRISAERDIEKGEELTFDYSTDVDWTGFSMRCTCERPDCRKVIRAYRFLSEEVKLRYGRHVAPFILREYFGRRGSRRSGPVKPDALRAVPRSP